MRTAVPWAAVAATILAPCAWIQTVWAGHSESGNATTLSKDDFDEYLMAKREKQRLALVMFHVSWCKVCQKTFPKFVAAASLVAEKGIAMDFAHVDCTNDKTLCRRYNVKGYPTIKLFTTKADVEPVGYRSQRSEEGFVKYAQRMTLPPMRQFTSSAELQEVLRHETFSAFVVAAADPTKPPAGLLEAAETWRDRHVFAVAPRLQDLLPEGVSSPAGAMLAVLSAGTQQWSGANNSSEASPAVHFFKGDFTKATVVNDWVEKNRFPGIWSLGETNFYAFTHASRRTAMLAVDPTQVSATQEQTFRKAAARLEEDFLFGVLDGVSWAEELADFNIARKELPRVLVSEEDFEVWFEDVEELKIDRLEEDLNGLISGKKKLLRQGRSVYAKAMFYKREAWRFMVFLHAYSRKGPKEALLALCLVIAATFMVMAAGWCTMSCCNILLNDDQDVDFTPMPKAQVRRPKKDD